MHLVILQKQYFVNVHDLYNYATPCVLYTQWREIISKYMWKTKVFIHKRLHNTARGYIYDENAPPRYSKIHLSDRLSRQSNVFIAIVNGTNSGEWLLNLSRKLLGSP